MSAAIDRLVQIMARLRNPDGGCPWDLEQTYLSLAPHTLEETYEVIEAIEAGAPDALSGELGDLLFQIVFYAQIGRERHDFDLDLIATQVADKMVERHPHVFGDRDVSTAESVVDNWEKDKALKRSDEARAAGLSASALDGVSTALPAATRAIKLQKRAARVGFDWSEAKDILAKIREEIDELEHEMLQTKDKGAMEDELGDVFFAIANLARHLEIDPETALRRTNRKFESRFRSMEAQVAKRGVALDSLSLAEMEALWVAAKDEEKRSKA